MIRIIAKRYAQALVALSYEKGLVDKTRADLAAFTGVVESQESLRKLFASPAFPPEAKKNVIAELAGRLGLQQTTKHFIAYLAETGRIRHFREVQEAFEEILAERQNRAMARVTTAVPLQAGEAAEIRKQLESLTGKQVEVDAKVDPSLIGGARAQIGSVIYDGAISSQLGRMREKLIK